MVFLYDHLKKGSFRTAYADTDSMCLGLTQSKPLHANMSREEEYRAIFDPIVKPNMRDSWEENWKTWFVTTSEVEDERFPGKLKSKIPFYIRLIRIFELTSIFKENLVFKKADSVHYHRNVTFHWIPLMTMSKWEVKVSHTLPNLSFKCILIGCTIPRLTMPNLNR